ncbi:MAG TPA: NAD(P)/FAD-dependent oxidoreductase [Chthoniobacterales bacterium]|nr:NAD(P)/FAD-dependent oxidoreductase [Chthoniobacterales bacterium]
MTEIVVVGGGAAGFFAAIAAALANRNCNVSLFERSSQFLSKVRVSGGGRCNVTHALFDPRIFTTRYPRGERELISPFHRFSADDTVAWFEARGVRLKREEDGRIFPVTDSSETVIDCLINEAKAAGVRVFTRKGIESGHVRTEGGFELKFNDGESTACDRLLLATGGCRSIGGIIELVRSLGHTIEPPVPSLFSLHVPAPWLRSLPGLSVSDVELSVEKLRERGPLLITHNGISGPAVLRLSAWGARILYEKSYRFSLHVNWVPHLNEGDLRNEFQSRRQTDPTRRVNNSPIGAIPARLWEKLVSNAGVFPETIWTSLTRAGMNELVRQLRATELEVDGKSLNKEEFVTCGGVRLREINFKTMESRVTPNLYFAGELLDVDGITGGFNFQAAWTTGWIAGHAMAGVEPATV